MDFGRYLERVRQSADQADADCVEVATLEEAGRPYPLLRLTVPGRRLLIITAGFHGEEPAGPLTLAEHLPELARYARKRGVGLAVYPCINPSGFEDGTRYNRSGERPNNDFLRYEVAPGEWRGELVGGEPFLRFGVHTGGPKETRALVRELELQPVPHAALDIHQDHYLGYAGTYAYVFGPQSAYSPLVEQSARHVEVLTARAVDDQHHTDQDGLIRSHDGSVTDYFHRRGVPFTAALETTTHTQLDRCHQVNLVWLRGFVDLAAFDPGS